MMGEGGGYSTGQHKPASLVMTNRVELPRLIRFEIAALTAFWIIFGLLNQIAQLTTSSNPLYFSFNVPGGAAIVPGVLLVIAGVGTAFRFDWALKLGFFLSLVHIAVTGIFWPDMYTLDYVYIIFCLAGAVEAWRLGQLLRKSREAAQIA